MSLQSIWFDEFFKDVHKEMMNIKQHGMEPRNLYLGKDDWAKLKNAASSFLYLTYDVATVKQDRAKFNGLDIYIVDDENHLSVS